MIDGTGTIITRQPHPETWVGRNFNDDPLVQQLLQRSQGSLTMQGIDDVRRMYGFVQLPGTEARLAVGLDEQEVLRRVKHATEVAYGQLGLIAVLLLIAIWLSGERLIVKPIHSLAAAARRLGRGEPSERITDQPWVSEFVPLAVALDDMATELSIRENELRAANDRLRELAAAFRRWALSIEAGDSMVVVFTPRGFAAALADAIDDSNHPHVLATVSGENTILVVPAAGVLAADLRDELSRHLLEGAA
jgi:HAMP domain-containing protein